MNRRFILFFRLLCVLLAGAWSCAALADAEHDRIAAARSAANSKLAEQERECATRFIVSSCVEEARSAHRTTLSTLRQQELKLDEARRRESAAARRKAIAERVEGQAGRASEPQPDAPSVRLRERRAPDPVAAPRSDPGLAPSAKRPAPGEQAAAERRSEAKYADRAKAAQAHREAVAKRNAQRMSEGKVAAPLPVPGSGASAPR